MNAGPAGCTLPGSFLVPVRTLVLDSRGACPFEKPEIL